MLPLGAKGVLCGHGFPFAGLKYELFSVTALAAGNARRIRTRPAMGTCLSCSFVVPVQIFSITETLSRQDSTENLAANQRKWPQINVNGPRIVDGGKPLATDLRLFAFICGKIKNSRGKNLTDVIGIPALPYSSTCREAPGHGHSIPLGFDLPVLLGDMIGLGLE